MPRGSGWIGRIFVFPGRLMYVGAVAPTELHAHHAVQIGWALGGSVLRVEDDTGAVVDTDALVVPNDVPHAIRNVCPHAIMLYIEPESRDGARALALSGSERSASGWADAAESISRPRELPRTIADAARIAESVVGGAEAPSNLGRRAMHPAVRRTVALLNRSLDRHVRLEDISATVGLSTGRLRHAFADDVGIPLRRYVLWRRLMIAAECVREGLPLTIAAQQAGFVDSAHLTKTFRSTFGLAPSDAMAGIEWVIATT